MIETPRYVILLEILYMSEIMQESNLQDKDFWKEATKYASKFTEDESFVNEMAYMMVTLHRTGA